MIIANGVFSGRGGHILTGSFSIGTTEQGLMLTTSHDFFFDGSADPGWVLAKQVPANSADPSASEAAKTSSLPHLGDSLGFPYPEVTGRQTTLIPSSLNIEDYCTLFLWCHKSQFLLGVGPFKA